MKVNLEHMWNNQRAMMLKDPKLAEQVKADCKFLESEVDGLQHNVNFPIEAYGRYFTDFAREHMDKKPPIVTNYDHRYKVSPSRS